jgi:protease I
MTHESKDLNEKLIAILATNGFEEIELTGPMNELEGYGASVKLISGDDKITSWDRTNWGKEFEVDVKIEDASASDFDALIIPGGVINGDKLRRDEKAIELVKEFAEEGKLIAAICHGPWMLIEAELVNGKTLTSHRAISTDMKNAGTNYVDNGVAEEGKIITAQGPSDIPAFMKKIHESLKPAV